MVRNLELHLSHIREKMEFSTMQDYSRPVTPDTDTNGIMTPRTPKSNGLALTEYTANPSPPSESEKKDHGVPEAFLLPNGYPDVCVASVLRV